MAVIRKINFAIIAHTLYADDVIGITKLQAFICGDDDGFHNLFFNY